MEFQATAEVLKCFHRRGEKGPRADTEKRAPAAFSPDGKLLATGLANRVQLWDLATKKVAATLDEDHPKEVASLAFSADSRMLLSMSNGGVAWIWDVATKESLRKLDPGAQAEVWARAAPSVRTLKRWR